MNNNKRKLNIYVNLDKICLIFLIEKYMYLDVSP